VRITAVAGSSGSSCRCRRDLLERLCRLGQTVGQREFSPAAPSGLTYTQCRARRVDPDTSLSRAHTPMRVKCEACRVTELLVSKHRIRVAGAAGVVWDARRGRSGGRPSLWIRRPKLAPDTAYWLDGADDHRVRTNTAQSAEP